MISCNCNAGGLCGCQEKELQIKKRKRKIAGRIGKLPVSFTATIVRSGSKIMFEIDGEFITAKINHVV